LNDQFVFEIGVKSNHQTTWKPNSSLPYTIVMVARFSDYAKRQDIILEAFKTWSNSNAKLIFFGEGPMLDHYKAIVNNDLFLSEHVELRGFVEPDKVKDQLLHSHLFCLCTDYEGVPKSVLEAMAIGVPVLVSDIEAHGSIVDHGGNGFVTINDSALWVEEINRIYEMTPDQLSLISKNSMDCIGSHHSLENSANEYFSEFKRIIDLP
jgi:glycosyltransferase involved in cell wall biosynthesis